MVSVAGSIGRIGTCAAGLMEAMTVLDAGTLFGTVFARGPDASEGATGRCDRPRSRRRMFGHGIGGRCVTNGVV